MWSFALILAFGMASQKAEPQPTAPCGQPVSQAEKSREVLARYPKEWNVQVRAGTKLDILRKELEKEAYILPQRDLEDRSPLPAWFRVYMRKADPNLPTSGAYQYPRTAGRVLQQIVNNPDTVEMPKSAQ